MTTIRLMNNTAPKNALAPWIRTPDSSFCKAAEPEVLRRVWLKVPIEKDTYLCAQKLQFAQAVSCENVWRILVLEPVGFSASHKPSRFQRKSLFMLSLADGTRTALFSYEAMMDALWAYFEPAHADPLREHKDHFVQEMSRCAINLDLQDKNLYGFVYGGQSLAAA
ncbi:MAG: hypothetical protein WC043_00160 [Pseudobdellovibrionaceae bacterium]